MSELQWAEAGEGTFADLVMDYDEAQMMNPVEIHHINEQPTSETQVVRDKQITLNIKVCGRLNNNLRRLHHQLGLL